MKSDSAYIAHILEAIDAIDEYCATSQQDFLKDRKTKDAVLRNFQVIGEAARKLSDDFRKRVSAVEWSGIISLRNRIVHEYFDVDFEIVWLIAKHELSPLRNAIINAEKKK
jgi:uncharacterized protein with HEPN domain